MIAFGSSIIDPEAYRRYAAPGIRRAAEDDSEVLAYAAVGSTCRSYNLLLDAAAARENLEALVLVHQETEIADGGFCRHARLALADPDVAVAGYLGAAGVRSIAWWEGTVSAGPVVHHHEQHGGGDLAGFPWTAASRRLGEVDAVEGSLLVLSPWAVRNVRFDESLSLGHGYDVDYCLQVREAGRRVVTAEFEAIRHHTLELIRDHDLWVEGHIQLGEKWADREPAEDWKRRARRAEAERDAARTVAYSNTLKLDARLLPLERALAETTDSLSWRLTEPLRRLNQLRRR